VHVPYKEQRLPSTNVFRNGHEISEFEGFGLDDVKHLNATQIRPSVQLFCE